MLFRSQLNTTRFGCPALDPNFQCSGGVPLSFQGELRPLAGTNYVPRLSAGMEVQVMMPVVNAPFRLYWAYNPLRLNTRVTGASFITRSMFPPGGAGDFTYLQSVANFGPDFILKEPSRTFRFTVSTTF